MTSPAQPEGRGHLVEVDRAECLELLRSKTIGRLGWTGVNGPQVAPVNYVVGRDDTILFRTSPHSGIAKALYETQVAFEVDDTDEFLEAGWSVLVVGSTTYLRSPEAIPKELSDRPRPWAAGDRTMYIRIQPERITGRRVIAG
jgi:uncharacterized protein